MLVADAAHVPLPAESVALVVTSPPYWKHRAYADQDETQLGQEGSWIDYIGNLVSIFCDMSSILLPDAALVVNLGDTYLKKQKLFLPHRFAIEMQNRGWVSRQDTVWLKTNSADTATDRPCTSHEYWFLFSKAGKHYWNHDVLRRATTTPEKRTSRIVYDGKSEQTSTFRPPNPQGRAFRSYDLALNENFDPCVLVSARACYPGVHTATFPEAAVEPWVLAGSKEGDLVLDPFAGSGTVGLVCKHHGRRFVGLDLSPTYVEIATERLESGG